MKQQFNVRIRKQYMRRIQQESRNTLVTKDILAEVALENWFSISPDRRAQFYRTHSRKPYKN
jgi:uncharacterized protein (UPF0276 family)